MADAGLAVQSALKAALDAALSVSVYDHVPQGAAFPYVLIGDDTAVDEGDKSEKGQELTATIHAWSRERGRWQVKTLLGEVYDRLHEGALAPDGWTVVYMRFDFAQSFLEPDGLTYHGVHRYRLLARAA